MRWKDISSYSRGDKERTPRSWQLEGPTSLNLTVHRMHGIDGLWFVSCHAAGLDRVALVSQSLEGAQQEAWDRARQNLQERLRQLQAAWK